MNQQQLSKIIFFLVGFTVQVALPKYDLKAALHGGAWMGTILEHVHEFSSLELCEAVTEFAQNAHQEQSTDEDKDHCWFILKDLSSALEARIQTIEIQLKNGGARDKDLVKVCAASFLVTAGFGYLTDVFRERKLLADQKYQSSENQLLANGIIFSKEELEYMTKTTVAMFVRHYFTNVKNFDYTLKNCVKALGCHLDNIEARESAKTAFLCSAVCTVLASTFFGVLALATIQDPNRYNNDLQKCKDWLQCVDELLKKYL